MRDEAIEMAAQCWCDERTKHIVMDADLAKVIAEKFDKLLSETERFEVDLVESLMNKLGWYLSNFTGRTSEFTKQTFVFSGEEAVTITNQTLEFSRKEGDDEIPQG